MGNFIDTGAEQIVSKSSFFRKAIVDVISEDEQGRIFKAKNFAKDWDSVYVHPSELDYGTAEKGLYRKIKQPAFILSTSPEYQRMAYVVASEENPVYVVNSYSKVDEQGFFMVWILGECVIPDFIFFRCKHLGFEVLTLVNDKTTYFREVKDCGETICLPEVTVGWELVGGTKWVYSDEYYGQAVSKKLDHKITAEELFFSNMPQEFLLPTYAEQERLVENDKKLDKMLKERIAEKERKFLQKEWLNEEHIRNSKHRLSNDIMPIRMSVERLLNFFKAHPDGVKPTDIIGAKSGRSVEVLIGNLLSSVDKMSDDIDNLTRSETVGELAEEIDVVRFLNDYCEKIAVRFEVPFKIEKVNFDVNARINISRKSFMELLDNIVDNAVRHGFTEKRDDYVVRISIEISEDRKCKISIANNGKPMSERAKDIYFVRGEFAGQTGHSGLGGNIVFDICDKAGGEALIPTGDSEFPVIICVSFPIV